jgi:hypothetical protein
MEIEEKNVVAEPEKTKPSPTQVQTPVQVEAPPKASPTKQVQKTPERKKEEDKDDMDEIMSGLAVAAGSGSKS